MKQTVLAALAGLLALSAIGPPVQAAKTTPILASVQLTADPVDIDVDDVGGRVFVLFGTPATISIRDSRSLQELSSISLGGTASRMVVDQRGAYGLVIGAMGDGVRIVDLERGVVLHQLSSSPQQVTGAVPSPGGAIITLNNGLVRLYGISDGRLLQETDFGTPLVTGAVGTNLYLAVTDSSVAAIPIEDLTGQRTPAALRTWPVADGMFRLVGERAEVILGGAAGLQRLDTNTGSVEFRATESPVLAVDTSPRHLPSRLFWSQNIGLAGQFHISDARTLSDIFSFNIDAAISDIAVGPGGVFALSQRAARLFSINGGATGAGQPRSVTASLKPTSIIVRWKPPAVTGSGGITRYEAQVSPSGKKCVTSKNSCVIRGLAPDTIYQLRVRARNQLGWGADSRVIRVQTRSVPTPVRPSPALPSDPAKPSRPVS